MKIKDIRELTLAEIKARVKDESDHLMRLRLNNAVTAIEKPSHIRESRRTIARLQTVLRQREIENQPKKA